jgi:hypothetical protein
MKSTLGNLEPHMLAEQFPLLEGDDFKSFKRDIKMNGLKVPILLFQGKILDGRNRYRACRELGIEPTTENFEGSESEASLLVLALNLHRRHLSQSQKRRLILYKITVKPELSDRDAAWVEMPASLRVSDLQIPLGGSCKVPLPLPTFFAFPNSLLNSPIRLIARSLISAVQISSS